MDASVRTSALGRGFSDPVLDSQRCFRAILAAMAEPGTAHVLDAAIEPPAGLQQAAATVLLTLADHETPVWLAASFNEALPFLRFHCGSPAAGHPAEAQFAVVNGAAMPALSMFTPGEDCFPDRSATVIVQCAALDGGNAVELAGPGIRGVRRVAPTGIGPSFWNEIAANSARYPLGVDVILASSHEILCLPRSTRVVAGCGASHAEGR